jgi:hypothetical protein
MVGEMQEYQEKWRNDAESRPPEHLSRKEHFDRTVGRQVKR